MLGLSGLPSSPRLPSTASQPSVLHIPKATAQGRPSAPPSALHILKSQNSRAPAQPSVVALRFTRS